MNNLELGKEIDARHAALKKIKEKYKPGWLEIAKFFNPMLLPLLANDSAEAETLAEDLFDGTGLKSAVIMMNGLVGMSVSQSTPWHHFEMEDPYIMKDLRIREWCQNASIAHAMNIGRSNFYNMLPGYVFQGITTGPGVMYVDHSSDGSKLVFSNRHIAEIYTDLDFDGTNNCMNREFDASARSLVQRFGLENLPESIQNAYNNENPEGKFQEFKILHSVFPSEESIYSSIGKNFVSAYKAVGESGIISERGYSDFPYIVWNWEILSNEKYPRTPAHIALVDTKGLQSMSKTMLKSGEFMSDNPINAPEEMRGEIRNFPRGVMYYRDPARVVTRVPGPTAIPYAGGIYDSKVKVVEDHFYVDFFKMLAQLTQRMTTIEVMERQNEKLAQIGVPISRFHSDPLTKAMERSFMLEFEAGRIPPPPTKLGGENMKIKFTGPLAILQRRLAEGQPISRALTEMAPIFQMFPDAGRVVKSNELVSKIMDIYDFPASARKSPAEIQKEIMAALQEQQRQAALQESDAAAKLLPGMAKAKEAGVNVAV